MADVFISYSQKDRDIARGLADLFNDCGYDVWWDYELVGGVKFRNKIKEELAKARAAIVIWTPNSVESDWVIEEADQAKQTNKLTATRIDGFDYRAIPLGFRSLQTEVITASERILKAPSALSRFARRPN
jgi:TIR domain-containing protein